MVLHHPFFAIKAGKEIGKTASIPLQNIRLLFKGDYHESIIIKERSSHKSIPW